MNKRRIDLELDPLEGFTQFTEQSMIYCKPEEHHRTLTIVAMPAFNEEENIARIVIGARKYANKVIVMDDGSTDETARIAEAHEALVVKNPTNRGYGDAIKKIFDLAKKLGADKLVTLDADGQHDPDDIPKLLALLDAGADVAIGSRFLEGVENHIPTFRRVGLGILNVATRIAGSPDVSDSQSGFRAYGYRAIHSIKLNSHNMSIGSEILVQIADNHLKVEEAPIYVRYDLEKTSSENPVYHGFSVLSSVIGIIGYRRPIISFGVPGGVMILSGVLLPPIVFTTYYATTWYHFASSLMSSILIIVGFLLMITALKLKSTKQNVKVLNEFI